MQHRQTSMLRFSPIRESFSNGSLSATFSNHLYSFTVGLEQRILPPRVSRGHWRRTQHPSWQCVFLPVLRYFKRPLMPLRLSVTCTPINFLAIGGGSSCSSQPVCCENNNFVCPDSYLMNSHALTEFYFFHRTASLLWAARRSMLQSDEVD